MKQATLHYLLPMPIGVPFFDDVQKELGINKIDDLWTTLLCAASEIKVPERSAVTLSYHLIPTDDRHLKLSLGLGLYTSNARFPEWIESAIGTVGAPRYISFDPSFNAGQFKDAVADATDVIKAQGASLSEYSLGRESSMLLRALGDFNNHLSFGETILSLYKVSYVIK